MFSCVRSSQDLCGHAHVHSLEGSVMTIIQIRVACQHFNTVACSSNFVPTQIHKLLIILSLVSQYPNGLTFSYYALATEKMLMLIAYNVLFDYNWCLHFVSLSSYFRSREFSVWTKVVQKGRWPNHRICDVQIHTRILELQKETGLVTVSKYFRVKH